MIDRFPMILAVEAVPADSVVPAEPLPAGGATGVPPTGPVAPREPSTLEMFAPLLLMSFMLLLLYVMVVRPRKKEEQQRQSMIDALKKGDKVVTVGGLIGTVMDLRDDEITLKVDENNNTRIRFSRAAVSKVMNGTAAEIKK